MTFRRSIESSLTGSTYHWSAVRLISGEAIWIVGARSKMALFFLERFLFCSNLKLIRPLFIRDDFPLANDSLFFVDS